MNSPKHPKGFYSLTTSLGIKDDKDDFMAIVSERPANLAAVFTRSRFSGPSVNLSRKVSEKGTAKGVIVISRNANVATGPAGYAHALEIQSKFAAALGASPEEFIIASTGVIGQQYPMEKIRKFLHDLPTLTSPDFARCASAIMTTDTCPKCVSKNIGDATLVGIAKGVGMIEPNMATMLAFFFTDAEIEQPVLNSIFRRVVDKTFNALSIDTDTSTSDSATILANGLAGPVNLDEFETALYELALELVRKIAADGEGASKLIEVVVFGARDDTQAKLVSKAIINSPLVKTAVHGEDPNWGRVAMAIGKCEEEHDIHPENVRINFGDIEAYPQEPNETHLEKVKHHLSGNEIIISVDLGIGDGKFTTYGCDLTDQYIRINADYTT